MGSTGSCRDGARIPAMVGRMFCAARKILPSNGSWWTISFILCHLATIICCCVCHLFWLVSALVQSLNCSAAMAYPLFVDTGELQTKPRIHSWDYRVDVCSLWLDVQPSQPLERSVSWTRWCRKNPKPAIFADSQIPCWCSHMWFDGYDARTGDLLCDWMQALHWHSFTFFDHLIPEEFQSVACIAWGLRSVVSQAEPGRHHLSGVLLFARPWRHSGCALRLHDSWVLPWNHWMRSHHMDMSLS